MSEIKKGDKVVAYIHVGSYGDTNYVYKKGKVLAVVSYDKTWYSRPWVEYIVECRERGELVIYSAQNVTKI